MKEDLWTLLQTTSFFLRNKIRLFLVSQIKSCGNTLALSADQLQEEEVKGVFSDIGMTASWKQLLSIVQPTHCCPQKWHFKVDKTQYHGQHWYSNSSSPNNVCVILCCIRYKMQMLQNLLPPCSGYMSSLRPETTFASKIAIHINKIRWHIP